MLAVLLLPRPGRTVGAFDLIDAIWGDDPPNAAMTTLRTFAWRWRKVLENDRTTPDVLVSDGGGYRLTVPENSVDARQAEVLATQAERAGAADRVKEARDLLNRALACWEGEPLAGIPGPYAEGQRQRLSELRLTLLEERISFDLELGRAGRCIPELTALTAQDAFRERPYALLMRALYQTGRQADALAVFRSARRTFIDELGVEPTAELETLHQRVLDGDPSMAPRAASRVTRLPRPAATPAEPPEQEASASPARRPADVADEGGTPTPPDGPALPRPAQLPADAADFTGRTALAAALYSALTVPGRKALAMVTVVGMGGVGKTTLALHVAHRARDAFPDGQLYANLHGGDTVPADPGAVLAGFLTALDVAPDTLPDDLEARSALFRSTVDGRRLLIVLDDARDAAQVRALLPGSAGCVVLVTSRFRLSGLPAVLQSDLEGFHPSEAIELLGRVIGPERVVAERSAALELVSACGFLPLAVRIVASRLAARPKWTIQTLSDRLADERRRIDELRIGDLAVEAAFELGYKQLTKEQAHAFRLVAAVDGPAISLASAAALLDMDEQRSEELLESLVDVAVLESPSAGRYRYHDLLRAFARRKSEAEPAAQAAAIGRLLDHLLATACSAFQQVVPGDPTAGALGPACSTGVVLTSPADARTWAVAEGENAHALAAQITRTVLLGEQDGRPAQDMPELSFVIDLLIALSPFTADVLMGVPATTAQLLVEAAEKVHDRKAQGRARFLCGNIALSQSRLDKARSEALLAVKACREVGDSFILRQALNDLGLACELEPRYGEAIRYYEEAISIARDLGHRSGEVASTVNVALARIRSGGAAEAMAICQDVLALLETFRDDAGTAYVRYVLGLAHHALERYAEAADCFTDCLTLCTAIGLRRREAQARYRLADTLRLLGRRAEAVDQARQALAACEDFGDQRDQANALVVLGRAHLDQGRVDESLTVLEQALRLYRRLGLPDAEPIARLIDGLTRPTA